MNYTVLLFLWLGAAIFVLLALPIIFQLRKAHWIETRGEHIVAKVTSVQHDKKRTSTGAMNNFYTVTAVWTNPRTGHTYTFGKYLFNENPNFAISPLVPVIIDPRNPKRYEIQL